MAARTEVVSGPQEIVIAREGAAVASAQTIVLPSPAAKEGTVPSRNRLRTQSAVTDAPPDAPVPERQRLQTLVRQPGVGGESISPAASISDGPGRDQPLPATGQGEPGDAPFGRGGPPLPPDEQRVGPAGDDNRRAEALRRISDTHAQERETYQQEIQGQPTHLALRDETAAAFFAPDMVYQKCEDPSKVRLKVIDRGSGHISMLFVESRQISDDNDAWQQSEAEFRNIYQSRNIDADFEPPEGVDPMRWEFSGNLEHFEQPLYAIELEQFNISDPDLFVKTEKIHPEFQDPEVVEALHKSQREFAQLKGYRLLLSTNAQEKRGNGQPYEQLLQFHGRVDFQLELQGVDLSTVIIDDLSEDYKPKPFPYQESKAPVMQNVAALSEFMDANPGYFFTPYLAYKPTEQAWDRSHARATLNRGLPLLIAPPINIAAGDNEELAALFEVAENNPAVAAVNITQPHKSNAVLRALFPDGPANVDALIRDETGRLVPFDLNGPSFMAWYEEKVGSFEGKTVVLVGAGGAGESIARRVIEKQPTKIVLVDPNTEKERLQQELSRQGDVNYATNLQQVTLEETDDLVVINAAGLAGENDPALRALLQSRAQLQGQKVTKDIFIDLRSQSDLATVEQADEREWDSYTGKGMNARNDYTLISKIAEVIGQTPPSFAQWQRIVEEAS